MAEPLIIGENKALIFVLDDEPGAARLFAENLARRMDATVKYFMHFDEMSRAEDLQLVDLFVLDVNLGDGLSGFDIPACLPIICRFSAFLFISGYPVDQDQYDRAKHLAFYDFIAKPFPMVHLAHRVNLLLASRLKMPTDLDDRVLNLWSLAPFVAVVLDKDFAIRLCNKQLATLLEVEGPRDLAGRSWAEFLPDDMVGSVRRIHSMVLSGDLDVAGEVSNDMLSTSGKKHRVKWFNSPFEGVDGEALTLSIGVPTEYKARMANRLRRTWKESILKHRAAIQAIRRMPLSQTFPDACQLDGGE